MNGRGETTQNVDLDWDNTISLEVFPLWGVGDTKDLCRYENLNYDKN